MKKSGLNLKKMSEEHIGSLLKIESTSDENFWTREAFEMTLAAKNQSCLVAVEQEKPIGFIAVERIPKLSYIQIWNLVVLPEYRNKGVGALLVNKLIEMVPKEYQGISFNVRASNLIAQRFLKKLEFWCESIAQNYFIDHVLKDVRKEDAYHFDFNPNKVRSKDVTIRIIDRLGNVVAESRTRPRSERKSPLYIAQRHRHS